MAEPTTFPQVNNTWYGEGDIGPLPVFQDDSVKLSKWRLSWFERIRVLVTGTIWLHVWAVQHPAVNVSGEYPFEKEQ